MHARHSIWTARQAGMPYPWTTDQILSTVRFPNVYRELDTGTRWIRQQFELRPPDSIEQLLLACAVYRVLNWIPTFQRHGLPYTERELDTLVAGIENDRRQRVKYATDRHQPKPELFRRRPIWDTDILDRFERATDGFEASKALTRKSYIGDFFAIQIIADYIGHKLSHLSPDTIVPIAVGGMFGSHLIRTGEIGVNVTANRDSRRPCKRSQLDVLEHLHDRQRAPQWRMTYVDVEHSLCEWYRWRAIHAGTKVSLAIRYP